jgi:hypothetical protein
VIDWLILLEEHWMWIINSVDEFNVDAFLDDELTITIAI